MGRQKLHEMQKKLHEMQSIDNMHGALRSGEYSLHSLRMQYAFSF